LTLCQQDQFLSLKNSSTVPSKTPLNASRRRRSQDDCQSQSKLVVAIHDKKNMDFQQNVSAM
jgi:hypothetical protein